MQEFIISMEHMHKFGTTRFFKQKIKAGTIHEARDLAHAAKRRMKKRLKKEGYKFETAPHAFAWEA